MTRLCAAMAASSMAALIGCGGSTETAGGASMGGPEPELAWGKACPGASDGGGGVRCRTDDECVESQICQSYRAPSCSTSQGDCYDDSQCEGGQVCAETGIVSCFGSSPPRTCRAPCSDGSCSEGDACGTDGHCRPVTCEQGYACGEDQVCAEGAGRDEHGCRPASCADDAWSCPQGFECRPGDDANQNDCVPISCTAGFECSVNTRCRADSAYLHAHQCEALACAQDSDCDCGYCVRSFCQSALSYCGLPPIG